VAAPGFFSESATIEDFMARPRRAKPASNQNPYEFLVEHIVMGEYPPGASLSEQEIALELGISRTPVREALLRLRLEELVRIVPRGGIFVAEATLRRVREVTATRLVLEEYLAHLVVERASEAWIEKFESWLNACQKNWDSLSSRDWMLRDSEFHLQLEEASGNEVLANHLGLLRRQAVLFWGQTTDGKASLFPIIRDFEETLGSIQDKDVLKCVEVLHRHVLAHVDRIQNYMKPQSNVMMSSKILDPTRS
jgi:GntR family transcriptional regulator, rspAB operon transcriptional repressor